MLGRHLDELFVLCKSGIITAFSTQYQPAKQLKTFEESDGTKQKSTLSEIPYTCTLVTFDVAGHLSCLSIYEYTMDEACATTLSTDDKNSMLSACRKCCRNWWNVTNGLELP